MDHDELRSLIPAYALGAVPADEIGVIRDHILSCDECMAEADRYSAVTSSIALAVEPVALSEGFEDRVLTVVQGQGSGPVPLTRGAPWWRRWSTAAVAASLSAALVLGLLFVDARMDAQRRLDVVAAVLQDDGLELRGDGVTGKVAELPDGSGVFVVSGLDEAPTGTTYVLWSMKGEGCPADPADCVIEPAGTFEVADGVGILELDGSISDWSESAVTAEEDEEAKAPTTDPVASSFPLG